MGLWGARIAEQDLDVALALLERDNLNSGVRAFLLLRMAEHDDPEIPETLRREIYSVLEADAPRTDDDKHCLWAAVHGLRMCGQAGLKDLEQIRLGAMQPKIYGEDRDWLRRKLSP